MTIEVIISYATICAVCITNVIHWYYLNRLGRNIDTFWKMFSLTFIVIDPELTGQRNYIRISLLPTYWNVITIVYTIGAMTIYNAYPANAEINAITIAVGFFITCLLIAGSARAQFCENYSNVLVNGRLKWLGLRAEKFEDMDDLNLEAVKFKAQQLSINTKVHIPTAQEIDIHRELKVPLIVEN